MNRKRVVLCSWAISLIAVIGCGALVAMPHVSALYSKGQLNSKLDNGFATAKRLDYGGSTLNPDSCREVTKVAKNKGISMSSLRANYIDRSPSYGGKKHPPASYIPQTWLSGKGSPNTTNPVYVDYGATKLPIQINTMIMLCGDLVHPDAPNCSLSVAHMFSQNRWVTDSNPDTKPNSYTSGTCLSPAMTESNAKVLGASVHSSGSLSGSTNLGVHQMKVKRDNNSRYWFASPVVFTYSFNKPITHGGTLRLTLHSKQISVYRNAVYKCAITGSDSIFVSNDHDFRSNCYTYDDNLVLNIQLRESYDLKPTVAINPIFVTSGSTVHVSGSVENSGGTGSSGTKWQITKLVYGPGQSPSNKSLTSNNSNPCASFAGSSPKSCTTYKSGTRSFPVNATKSVDSSNLTIDEPIGSHVCFATSVSTPTPASSPKWRHSALDCTVVGKQPKLQIWGGDLRTGGDVVTSQSTIKGNHYGSWAEYGAFIGGLNQNSAFATAAAFSGSNGAATSVASQLNQMTFANSGVSGGGYGKFADPKLAQPAPVYQVMADNQLNIPKGAGSFTSNISGLSGDYQVGNVTINSSKIPAGKTILIRSSGTVTINGNISYAQSNFTSLGSIPQVIIVAKNIKITDKPTQINAWLLSQNSLNTCSNGPAALTTTTCKNGLQVNGPTASNSAQFRRTHGSDGASSASDPAETLNLRADAYLWEYRQASQKITPTTVQITQLPPRY